MKTKRQDNNVLMFSVNYFIAPVDTSVSVGWKRTYHQFLDERLSFRDHVFELSDDLQILGTTLSVPELLLTSLQTATTAQQCSVNPRKHQGTNKTQERPQSAVFSLPLISTMYCPCFFLLGPVLFITTKYKSETKPYTSHTGCSGFVSCENP